MNFYKEGFIGFDFIENDSKIYSFDIVDTNSKLELSNESAVGMGPGVPNPNPPIAQQNQQMINPEENGITYSMSAVNNVVNGITPEQARSLLRGESYLEFWIVAMDHSKRTQNRKLYPKEVFWAGCQGDFKKQLELGGVPGEGEHPLIQIKNDTTEGQQINQFNNLKRAQYVDPLRETHKIVAAKVEGDKTLWKIRTSLKKLDIVKDVLQGRMPCFSVRTVGSFSEPDVEGTIRAQQLVVLGCDYVYNPAVGSATLTRGNELDLKSLVNPENTSVIKIDSESKSRLGLESVDLLLETFMGEAKALAISNEGSLEQQLSFMKVVGISDEESRQNDMDKLFNSFLG